MLFLKWDIVSFKRKKPIDVKVKIAPINVRILFLISPVCSFKKASTKNNPAIIKHVLHVMFMVF